MLCVKHPARILQLWEGGSLPKIQTFLHLKLYSTSVAFPSTQIKVSLTHQCRPHRATTWDLAGVHAPGVQAVWTGRLRGPHAGLDRESTAPPAGGKQHEPRPRVCTAGRRGLGERTCSRATAPRVVSVFTRSLVSPGCAHVYVTDGSQGYRYTAQDETENVPAVKFPFPGQTPGLPTVIGPRPPPPPASSTSVTEQLHASCHSRPASPNTRHPFQAQSFPTRDAETVLHLTAREAVLPTARAAPGRASPSLGRSARTSCPLWAAVAPPASQTSPSPHLSSFSFFF